ERIGIGRFQYSILFAAGLCFMADSMEVLLLSFLSVVLKHEWYLTEHQMDSIFAVVFAGALFGTLLLGPAGDIYGRKPIFILTALIIAISGVITAFCTNYIQLVIARFFVGFGVGGLTVPFDTLGEFLPTKARGKNLLYIEFFWTFGTLSVPLLAYLTLDTTKGGGDGDGEDGGSHWQLFVILCSVPCFISTALGVILVPESPRWLLESTSHLEDDETGSNKAIDILRYAALKNELFNSPSRTRLTLLLWSTWFGLGFLYYGVILAVSIVFTNEEEMEDEANGGNGNGNGSYDFDYVAIFISASSEIFGLIIVLYTIDKFGRISSQTISYRIGGIATFLMDDTTYLHRYILIGLAFIARMAMMGASCTTWVSTSEILPTDIRSTGHGSANAMARLGGFI
ncbi:MFS general substrate transporter, partial [Fragilariopsis cylindrus CCMP1102]